MPTTQPPGFCRVTLLAPRRRVDVALPADLPLAELVPLVLELLGEPRRLAAWRFHGAAGAPLPADATLAALGVLDGDLLRIGPATAPPPPPVFDDPADALAAAVGGVAPFGPALRGWAVTGAATVAAALFALVGGLLAAGVAAAAAVACLLRGRSAGWPAGVCAVAFAAAAGWAAAPQPGRLLVAVAGAGVAAGLSPGSAGPVLVAVRAVVGALAAAASVHLVLGASPVMVAAGAGAAALAAGSLLPRLALRLAGVPQPAVPSGARELVAGGPVDLPPTVVARARATLAGLAGGAAVTVAGSAVVLAGGGGFATTCAIVNVVGLGLRARCFADALPARVTLGAALAGAAGVALVTGLGGGPLVRLLIATGLAGAAALAVGTAGRTAAPPSPLARRAVDLLDAGLTAAAIPLALAVTGAYAAVRGM